MKSTRTTQGNASSYATSPTGAEKAEVVVDERMQQLETYIKALKTQGGEFPNRDGCNAPHFRAVSAVSGIDFNYLIKEPYRQRVLLAAEEIGLTPKNGTQKERAEVKFFQKRAKLDNYFQWLNDNAFKLPEEPTHRGRVFFAQVAVEAGLSHNALPIKKSDGERAYNVRLRQSVEEAASSLGIEVRVLPQSPGHKQNPLTYEQLLEKGTEERKKELKDSRSAAAQLYNTRHALNLFLQKLKLGATAPIGPEFVAGFKSSVKKATGKISNVHSRKKFETEIKRWHDIHQRLLKGPAIPDDFHQALVHLVDRSGLSFPVLAKLIGVSSKAMSGWYQGCETPSWFSVGALECMESLFKLSAGTLVNKVPWLHGRRRYRRSELPPFFQQNPELFSRVRNYLPDNFCTLTPEELEEIVESIRTDILRGGDDEYSQRVIILRSLPYRLKDWPRPARAEFDSYADFKMAETPPLGMRRNGMWKPVSRSKHELDFAYLFGAIRLPPDADDVRLRGLGFPESQLTIALVVCPKIIDWHIKFRCEVRNQYTEYPIGLLHHYISMLRPDTGWLRQSPHLAERLRAFSDGNDQYISQDLVSRAQADWNGVCDDAIKEFQEMIKRIKPLVTVARDPFHPIEGLLALDDPMEPLGDLIQKMRQDLPDPHTAPVFYHTGIRDLVITTLLVVAGFRRGMFPKLDYTGDKKGHLYFEGDHYVLSVPRTFFKNPNSSYFQTNRVMEDYLCKLPDVHGLNEVFKEYLETSRPFLMKRYVSESNEQPLFIKNKTSRTESTSPRLGDKAISRVYVKNLEKYLVENKHRGTGLRKVKRAGPHSVRHVRGTTVYRKTGSYKLAGDANQHSERTARKHYSRSTTEERNQKVSKILF